MGKVRPDLYEKKSKAYPGKTLFHVLHMVPPRERGRKVSDATELKFVQRMLEPKDGDDLGGQPMLDQRGDPVYDGRLSRWPLAQAGPQGGGLPSGVWYTPVAAPLPAGAGQEARGPLSSD